MAEREADPAAERVLVAAPVGRDAAVIAQMLGPAGVAVECCETLADLAARIEAGAAAAVLTEEALTPSGLAALLAALRRQPAWSDLPLLVLTGPHGGGRAWHEGVAALEADTNVTLIERPVRVRTLVTAVHAARRARRRQYETREILAREQAARRAAEAANRLKDDFMATVSHELRTPLTAIVGWTRMLIAGTVAEDKRERALATIDRNARAQVQLVEDLLDFSRILAGKLVLDLRPVDVAAVVDLALESARPAAEVKGVRLAAALDVAGGATVLGDPDRLQQVVWNLLSNAIKFTPRGGRVDVALAREGGRATVTVTDTGEGIAPDFLPYVFDRFRQAQSGIDRTHGGLGLGLAIVKHLLEQHDGQIEARSGGRGRGATFVVRLPLVAEREARPAPPRAPGAAPDAPAAERSPEIAGIGVLFVDDEPDARELVREVLEARGAVVTTAATAAEALQRLRTNQVDVLVSDVGMAGETGYDLIQKVRTLPRGSGGDVPAVALTAYARGADRARSLAAGFDRHVAKPVEPGELVAVVAELASRRASRHSV